MKEGKEEGKEKRKQGGCEDMRYVRTYALGVWVNAQSKQL